MAQQPPPPPPQQQLRGRATAGADANAVTASVVGAPHRRRATGGSSAALCAAGLALAAVALFAASHAAAAAARSAGQKRPRGAAGWARRPAAPPSEAAATATAEAPTAGGARGGAQHNKYPGGVKRVWHYKGWNGVIEVFDRGDWRSLRFPAHGHLIQGRMHLTKHLEFGAVYLAPFCAAALAARPLVRAAVLGLGVGAVPRLLRALYPELTVDVVEIDNGVIQAARQRFGVSPTKHLAVRHADAAEWVTDKARRASYDLVGFDCYSGTSIPAALATREFFAAAVGLLRPRGVLVANVMGNGPMSTAAEGALQAVLRVPYRVPPSGGASNRIWFGHADGRSPDLDDMRSEAQRLDVAAATGLHLERALQRAEAVPAPAAVG
eukprot:TRINITY_DN60505_c0_g1_i1.p1 TRINITY_DN60505_c0_g1~~TRINITY_DN60505_c0_g1_i1.p1  ORF type:complete len:405 (+),score=86.41 TRINITY_DN60505_c0_g1_i1:75-1217(+)